MIVMQIRCLAARCADEYTFTHKDTNIKTLPKVSETKVKHLYSVPKVQFNNHAKSSNIKGAFKPLSPLTCTYCKKRGHIISKCFSLKWKQEGKDGSCPSALTSIRSAPKTNIKTDALLGSNKPTTQSDILHTYKPFISEGFISPNFWIIAEPLTNLLSKESKFVW